MTKDDADYIKRNKQIWRCSSCSSTRRKSMVSESTTGNKDVTLQELAGVLEVIAGNQTSMKENIKKMELELGKSIESCHQAINDINKKFDEQNKQISTCLTNIDKLSTEVASLRKENAELKERVEDMEQYSRSNMLEINGIPKKQDEDVTEIICRMSEALGHKIKADAIDICHRLKQRNENLPPPIVVKFVRRTDKQVILNKRKVTRQFSTKQMGETTDHPVYANESLAPTRRRIFTMAREIFKRGDIKYLWIKEGKILARKEDGTPVIELKNSEQESSTALASNVAGLYCRWPRLSQASSVGGLV
ncbi:uncharacterized protein LOC120352236 [Nilaparvata lugens]|uniref:uncharacterized protein LOC120352236 n=1 Tax=Nilaparvata lugens TaxID=108931 RepID=UPI00193DFC97|nr:uncharacterized protein LOC120352236 [Nilaparvata lugens]